MHTRKSISFETIDPLGDGLGDDIERERQEQEAITLEERPDEASLYDYWEHVIDDIHKDPEWFTFAEEE